mmetsp:Transcript_55214/g.139453  ORF Transcript_55214/g.139453 Transcript_55214/m.139453 type:complete len:282 (+) Transcript_55214:1444-2289(+)
MTSAAFFLRSTAVPSPIFTSPEPESSRPSMPFRRPSSASATSHQLALLISVTTVEAIRERYRFLLSFSSRRNCKIPALNSTASRACPACPLAFPLALSAARLKSSKSGMASSEAAATFTPILEIKLWISRSASFNDCCTSFRTGLEDLSGILFLAASTAARSSSALTMLCADPWGGRLSSCSANDIKDEAPPTTKEPSAEALSSSGAREACCGGAREDGPDAALSSSSSGCLTVSCSTCRSSSGRLAMSSGSPRNAESQAPTWSKTVNTPTICLLYLLFCL